MIRPFLIALTTAAGMSVAAFAQAPAPAQHQHEHGTSQAQPPSGQNQQQAMQMHRKMMAEMTAMDQKLDNLVAQMNGAQGQAKVDDMAAVINALVDQQKKMHQHMASMMGRGGMTGGMMGGGMMGGEGQPGMTMGTSGAMTPAADTFDPVCRAKIANNTAPTATYNGRTYQFCSVADKEVFLKDPAKYTGR